MAKEIFMPKLSSTMQIGTLLQWFKAEGDMVEEGEPLFEIMTDKINIEVESYEQGILLKKYYQADDEIPVNAIIGYIGDKDEKVPNKPPKAIDKGESSEIQNVNKKIRATPAARRIAKEQHIPLNIVQGTGPNNRIQQHDVEIFRDKKEKQATPLAKKIAIDKHIDMNKIEGSGTRGKVEKADVLKYAETKMDLPEGKELIKLKGLRKAVADKMLNSVQSIPHVTLTTEADMSNAIDMRQVLLPIIEQQTGYRLSFTEIIMKATAHALAENPKVNASLVEDEIIINQSIHIGLAVAVQDGLLVPVIRHADQKGLAALTENCKTLSLKARENKLSLAEMTGGTFTISNLGMYAIDGFTPIINPPETAILGIGRIIKKPVVIDDSIEIRPMMILSLSFNHRAIDGAPAAQFLTKVKDVLEKPYSLLL